VPDRFRLLTPIEELSLYQWHTNVWAVNVRCLDGVDFSSIPIKRIYGSRLD
jgi:hypothetical protein